MTVHKLATYQVVRYVPDLVKNEPINLGVILCAPDERRLLYRLPRSARELMLGSIVGQDNLQRLQATLHAARDEHLASLAAGDIGLLQKSLGNHFQFTPPRTWDVCDVEGDLDELFETFVSYRALAETVRRVTKTIEIRRGINHTFKKAGIDHKVTPVTREGRKTGVPVSAPWAWLNGTLNFAEAISLRAGDYPIKENAVRALVQRAEELTEDPEHYFTVFIAPPTEASTPDTTALVQLLSRTCRTVNYFDGDAVAKYATRVQQHALGVDRWPELHELGLLAAGD